MEKTGWKKNKYGLIGKDISYSFSSGHFSKKFEELGLSGHSYENFDLGQMAEIEELLSDSNLKGLNVTIPYKEEVIPYLDGLDDVAAAIGAVNTIKFTKEGLMGHNTDAFGFKMSLQPLLRSYHNKALILGTGGASKAVSYVLSELNIGAAYVSRREINAGYSYSELNAELIQEHNLIINCTPLGTHPNIDDRPDIPYEHLTAKHLLYDLIYNPEKSAFLLQGEKIGCTIKNGLEMLELQAEKSWEIWNSKIRP